MAACRIGGILTEHPWTPTEKDLMYLLFDFFVSFNGSAASHLSVGIRIKPVLQTWGRTLLGRVPSLSIEITRECPLRCPGCYAYEDSHLGTTNLRSLSDFKGEELIARVLGLIDEYK